MSIVGVHLLSSRTFFFIHAEHNEERNILIAKRAISRLRICVIWHLLHSECLLNRQMMSFSQSLMLILLLNLSNDAPFKFPSSHLLNVQGGTSVEQTLKAIFSSFACSRYIKAWNSGHEKISVIKNHRSWNETNENNIEIPVKIVNVYITMECSGLKKVE